MLVGQFAKQTSEDEISSTKCDDIQRKNVSGVVGTREYKIWSQSLKDKKGLRVKRIRYFLNF
mgnify:CR=1 FL=1